MTGISEKELFEFIKSKNESKSNILPSTQHYLSIIAGQDRWHRAFLFVPIDFSQHILSTLEKHP